MTGAPRAACVRALKEPYRANCCARYPLPEGVREYVVSRVMRSKRIARTPVLLPVGTPYHRTGKHCSVGRVLTMAMLPPSRHSWQGVQMDTSDNVQGQPLGTVTSPWGRRHAQLRRVHDRVHGIVQGIVHPHAAVHDSSCQQGARFAWRCPRATTSAPSADMGRARVGGSVGRAVERMRCSTG
jgi:hypothetical protein